WKPTVKQRTRWAVRNAGEVVHVEDLHGRKKRRRKCLWVHSGKTARFSRFLGSEWITGKPEVDFPIADDPLGSQEQRCDIIAAQAVIQLRICFPLHNALRHDSDGYCVTH